MEATSAKLSAALEVTLIVESTPAAIVEVVPARPAIKARSSRIIRAPIRTMEPGPCADECTAREPCWSVVAVRRARVRVVRIVAISACRSRTHICRAPQYLRQSQSFARAHQKAGIKHKPSTARILAYLMFDPFRERESAPKMTLAAIARFGINAKGLPNDTLGPLFCNLVIAHEILRPRRPNQTNRHSSGGVIQALLVGLGQAVASARVEFAVRGRFGGTPLPVGLSKFCASCSP